MLKKGSRVILDREFAKIYKLGKRVSTPNLNLVYLQENQDTSRFGFVVSKKQARRIVDRNRIKRRLRAQVMEVLPWVTKGVSAVMGGRRAVLKTSPSELREEVVKLLKKAGLLGKR